MDCTFETEQGKFNFRVGVIIVKDGKALMARNPNDRRAYYYSVGGRVQYGEEMTAAVIRELKEETGIDCEVDRLVCIHENFFVDSFGVPYHEISAYFTIKENDQLMQIENGHLTDHGPEGEYLTWIDLKHSDGLTLYPAFIKTIDFDKETDVKHFVTRE